VTGHKLSWLVARQCHYPTNQATPTITLSTEYSYMWRWDELEGVGVFSSSKKKIIPSHQMFGHIYRVLNVDEKITNYIDCDKFTRRIF
jgi:hypothetical protein